MAKRIGDVAMTDAERQRRRRDKAKTLRDAAAIQPVCPPSPPLFDLLGLDAERIADYIYRNTSADRARAIAAALQQRLWQGGSWPSWLPPILS